MPPLRISLATRCLNEPLRRALRTASDMGVQGVQFDAREELKPGDLTETGRRQFLHSLEELGLKVASLWLPTRRTFYDEDQLDARVAATRAVMDFAWSLACSVVTVRLGKIPADKDSPEHRILHEVVSDLAAYGNRVGATLAIVPVHDSPEALAGLIDSVKTGPVGIDFDPAGFVVSGYAAHSAYKTLHEFVVHMQARDALRSADGGGEMPLGRGEVDWVELLPLLDEAGYRGWMTIIRTQGDDKRGDMERAVTFLNNVLLG